MLSSARKISCPWYVDWEYMILRGTTDSVARSWDIKLHTKIESKAGEGAELSCAIRNVRMYKVESLALESLPPSPARCSTK